MAQDCPSLLEMKCYGVSCLELPDSHSSPGTSEFLSLDSLNEKSRLPLWLMGRNRHFQSDSSDQLGKTSLNLPCFEVGFGPEWKPKMSSNLHYSVILTSLNICYTITSAPFSPASIQMTSLGRGSCVLDVCTQADGSQDEMIKQKTQILQT